MKETDLAFLATLTNKVLTNRDVFKLIQIWRDNHSKWNTFFSMGRWLKEEGMPQGILDLVQLAKQLPQQEETPLDDKQATTLYLLCLSRINRNSNSFKNASSYSSEIYTAIMKSLTYQNKKNEFEQPSREAESVREQLSFDHIITTFRQLYPDQTAGKAQTIKYMLDWAQGGDPLIKQSYITYFEIAYRINNQKRFFEILDGSGCKYARTRELGVWAVSEESLLNLPNVNKLLGNTDDKGDFSRFWIPYAHSMGIIPADEDPTNYAEKAADFIMSLYGKRSCSRDDKYAPKGKLTKEGVLRYLTDVLAWDNKPLGVNTSSPTRV